MSRGLRFYTTERPGIFTACMGERSAKVVAHTCNGRACIGYDEPAPDQAIESKIAATNDFALARMIGKAEQP